MLFKSPFYLAASPAIFISAPLYAASLPENISKQIPAGYEEMTYQSGMLNDDYLTDYLVVIHHPEDSEENPSPRPLLIFVQNHDGTYKFAAKNDNVVMRANDGGQCDPFDDGEDGLVIKDHYFTVQNAVACGHHWTDYITFHYDANSGIWLFHKEVAENWIWNEGSDPNDGALKLDHRLVKSYDKKHPISFEAWKPD